MNYQIIIPILTFLSIVTIGGALIQARSARRDSLHARLSRTGSAEVAAGGPNSSGFHSLIEGIGNLFAPKNASAGLRAELARAGYYSTAAVAIYLGSKLVLLGLGLIIAAAVVSPFEMEGAYKVLIVISSGGVLFLIPGLIVNARKNARTRQVKENLPVVVDLLEICVSAGMGLDMAWNSVADEIRRVSDVLADEMSLTNLEIHLGASRSEAMRHMSERTGADELSSMVAMLLQSDRFGTSVRDALRTFATSMRELRSQRAEEAAEKMSVKLLFPLVMFVFPPIIIVTAGPAVIKIVQIMSN